MECRSTKPERKPNERGIALLVVLFALTLLTVIGLGMMYSTNMETAVNYNYRDKQTGLYAAMAGLQEARQRIKYPYSITPPTSLPSTSAANIIYIVSNATTVQPWDPANPYFDTELCHENILSLTGTAGVPYAATASGTAWYQVFDDSLSASAPWNLSYPLDWKWTRIQLKGNNNTPFPVNGSNSVSDQACWTGVYQMSTPTGYTTGCVPVGPVSSISVDNAGTGYTSPPTITFTGGDGTGATATASMVAETTGYVSAIPLGSGGSGYSTAPTVTLSGTAGTGATATATLATSGGYSTISGGVVSSITLSSAGSGYTLAPTVTISGGGGSGATATATLLTSGAVTITGGVVSAINITTGGSGYTSAPTVNISGAGSGATATAVLSTTGTLTVTGGAVTTVTVSNSGTAYTSAPTVSFSGGGGSGATATAVLSTSGSISALSGFSAGTQCYAAASDVIISFSNTGGTGSGATASAVLEPTKSCINGVSFPTNATGMCATKLDTNSPRDYAYSVTFGTGNGSFSGTLKTKSADDKSVESLTIVNPGYDSGAYSGTPTYYLTYSKCTNVPFTLTTGYRLSSINVTAGGSGYTSSTTVSISGGVGSTSNPTVSTISRGFQISSVAVSSGGSGYTTAPTVGFSGGGGSGAVATAALTPTYTTTYAVSSVIVNSGGVGYTSTPSITLSGGGGTGALATASIATNADHTYGLASITLNSGGSGYTSTPTVTLTGGAGSGGAATATVTYTYNTTYPVASITVVTGGTGYDASSPPTVTLSGGGGSGATATPTISTMTTGTYKVGSISVGTSGSGYTANPTVTFSGGGGSGATATATITGGTKYGKVWLLTSFAQTRSGARSMVQMEVASPVLGFASGGALTLDGPNPVMDAMPNSMNFVIHGADANTCHDAVTEQDHPAIDGFDDPNATPPTNSVETIKDALPRPDHYTGAGGTPSVQNGYGALGETMSTPAGLDAVMSALYNTPGAVHYDSSNVGSFNPSSTTTNSITYVDGNLTLNGNGTGHGILVVTGTLTMSGNFSWYGIVFVVGDGNAQMNGGGNGEIYGSIWVAKTWDNRTNKNLLSTLGSPTFGWNGGGGNGVFYDHCYVSNLMNAVNLTTLTSSRPLKQLSLRVLPY